MTASRRASSYNSSLTPIPIMARSRVKKRTHVGAKDGQKPVGTGPKSMVIRMGAGDVGSSVSQLVKDMRLVMEPHTASRLQVCLDLLNVGSSLTNSFVGAKIEQITRLHHDVRSSRYITSSPLLEIRFRQCQSENCNLTKRSDTTFQGRELLSVQGHRQGAEASHHWWKAALLESASPRHEQLHHLYIIHIGQTERPTCTEAPRISHHDGLSITLPANLSTKHTSHIHQASASLRSRTTTLKATITYNDERHLYRRRSGFIYPLSPPLPH